MATKLLLASASPRRAEMLRRVGIEFEIVPADVDETPQLGELPANYVARVAAAKAQEVATAHRDCVVLAADTTVTIDQQILGKPEHDADAVSMLTLLSGRSHWVLTAFAIVAHQRRFAATVTTEVEFISLSTSMIDDYVASGEWRGKAGGYAVQGIAAAMVRSVAGSITNVIGLPLADVVAELAHFGVVANLRRGRPQ
jgi:septum formation protein